ncbi:MAG: hypothetical protein LRZ99_02000 [Desulfotomaculum sp.]|nr:hypothetical protein [Desulfotomaculum sp.]
MEHPTHTEIIFANNTQEAVDKYAALGIKPDHDPNPKIVALKAAEEEDFDMESDINLIGEVSIGPPIMKKVRTNPALAYVVYYMEKH